MKPKKGDRDFNATLLNLMRGLVTAILVISVLAMFTAVASAADIYVNPGDSIQTAVDGATAGDTIHVAAGDYTENVNVNKAHLTLQGEGADVVTVTAESTWDHVFEVTRDYVNISGFTATGATGSQKAGIYLGSSNHCNISDNNASNNYYAIYLSSSSSNTLTSNTANSNDDYAIYLSSSSSNTLTSNTANSNDDYGILLSYSSNNNLLGNYAYDNSYHGIYLYSSSSNYLSGNNAYNNSYYGILLSSSSSNTLTDNTANSNYYYGIYLYSSSNTNELTSNTANSNYYYGIVLDSSSNNDITCNWVAHNELRGFWLRSGSTGNNISYNNIMSNGNYNEGTGGWEWNFYNEQSNDVVAEHNYWGTTTSEVTAAGIKEDTGSVDYDPFGTSPPPCAPIPEAATIILLLIGLLVLAGYLRVRRKD